MRTTAHRARGATDANDAIVEIKIVQILFKFVVFMKASNMPTESEILSKNFRLNIHLSILTSILILSNDPKSSENLITKNRYLFIFTMV